MDELMKYMDLDTYLQIGGMEDDYNNINNLSSKKTIDSDLGFEKVIEISKKTDEKSQLLKLYVLKLEIYSNYKYPVDSNLLTYKQKYDLLVKYYKDNGKTDKDIYDLIVNNDLGKQK